MKYQVKIGSLPLKLVDQTGWKIFKKAQFLCLKLDDNDIHKPIKDTVWYYEDLKNAENFSEYERIIKKQLFFLEKFYIYIKEWFEK